MSIEAHFAEQRAKDILGRVHNFVSSVGNALERIDILIDEDELDEAKQEIADLRESLSHVDDPHAYVVVYDTGHPDEPNEEYYGYFDSSADAERMFRQLNQPGARNVKICQIVKDLSE
jgi:hypothetical protein